MRVSNNLTTRIPFKKGHKIIHPVKVCEKGEIGQIKTRKELWLGLISSTSMFTNEIFTSSVDFEFILLKIPNG